MFSASGIDPQMLTFDFGSDAVGLVRGLDSSDLLGTRAAVVNLDYRLPLKQIERGVGTLPIFARVLHGAVFVDAGHAWTSSFNAADPTVSVGAATLARRCRRLCPATDIHDRLLLGLSGARLRGVRNHRPLLLVSSPEPRAPNPEPRAPSLELPNYRTTEPEPTPSVDLYTRYTVAAMATPDLYGQAVRALEQGRGADATTLLVRALEAARARSRGADPDPLRARGGLASSGRHPPGDRSAWSSARSARTPRSRAALGPLAHARPPGRRPRRALPRHRIPHQSAERRRNAPTIRARSASRISSWASAIARSATPASSAST